MTREITYVTPDAIPRKELYARMKKSRPGQVIIFIEGATASVQDADLNTAVALSIPPQQDAAKADQMKRKFIYHKHQAVVVDLNEPMQPRPQFIKRATP